MIAVAVSLLESPTPLELLTVPVVFTLVNFNEWHIHRNVLHRRTWPLEVLFWRHTPEHHVIFVRDDMAMRERREFRLVLIPFYGILAIFVSTLPITTRAMTIQLFSSAATRKRPALPRYPPAGGTPATLNAPTAKANPVSQPMLAGSWQISRSKPAACMRRLVSATRFAYSAWVKGFSKAAMVGSFLRLE